jgi:uncharacterized protein YwqG
VAYLTPDEVRERFTEAGQAELAAELIREARQAVRVRRERVEEGDIPLGGSKLGGRPDLPAGVEWPTRDGRPLAFLGQFALGDVPRAEGEAKLPGEGLLSIFYDFVEQPWGFAPKDRDGWRMLYWARPEGLERREAPKEAYAEHDEAFSTCRVAYEVVTTYPAMGNAIYEREDADELLEIFEESLLAGQGEDDPHHQFLGHPLLMQGPMEVECQLVSNGFYCGEPLPPEEQRRAEKLLPGAKDWTLLLQLDTDDEPGWMWGDMGILYFWVRREDLEAGAFEKGWCVLQCG